MKNISHEKQNALPITSFEFSSQQLNFKVKSESYLMFPPELVKMGAVKRVNFIPDENSKPKKGQK